MDLLLVPLLGVDSRQAGRFPLVHVRVLPEVPDLLARRRIPDLDGLIEAAGRQPHAVRAECEIRQVVPVASQGHPLGLLRQGPDAKAPVSPGDDDPASVGAPGDDLALGPQPADFPARRCVPDLDQAAVGRADLPPVGAQGGMAEAPGGTNEFRHGLTGGRLLLEVGQRRGGSGLRGRADREDGLPRVACDDRQVVHPSEHEPLAVGSELEVARVALEGPERIPGSDVPEADRAPPVGAAGRRQLRAVRAERHALHLAPVSREHPEPLPAGEVVDLDRAVGARGREQFALGTERDAVHLQDVAAECPQFRPRGGVPEPDVRVLAAGGEHGAIRAERDAPHRMQVPLEDMGRPSGLGIPQAGRSVVAARGEKSAVRAVRDGGDVARVAGEQQFLRVAPTFQVVPFPAAVLIEAASGRPGTKAVQELERQVGLSAIRGPLRLVDARGVDESVARPLPVLRDSTLPLLLVAGGLRGGQGLVLLSERLLLRLPLPLALPQGAVLLAERGHLLVPLPADVPEVGLTRREPGDQRQEGDRHARRHGGLALRPAPQAQQGARGPGHDGLVLPDAAEVLGQGQRRLVAAFAVPVDGRLDDDLEVLRDGPVEPAGLLRLRHQDLLVEAVQRGGLEGDPERQALVERHAEAVDVGPAVELDPLCRELLRAEVGRGPHERPGLGQALALALLPREAEVQQHRLPLLGHHDVVGLDVPVDEPLLVGHVQRTGRLLDEQQNAVQVLPLPAGGRLRLGRPLLQRRQRHDARGSPALPAQPDPLRERLPLQEAHRHVGGPVRFPRLVHRADVRVVELARQRRLALEAKDQVPAGGEVGGKDLQRHLAGEAGVLGQVHDSHPAPAELLEDPVRPHALPVGAVAGGRRRRGAGRRRGGRRTETQGAPVDGGGRLLQESHVLLVDDVREAREETSVLGAVPDFALLPVLEAQFPDRLADSLPLLLRSHDGDRPRNTRIVSRPRRSGDCRSCGQARGTSKGRGRSHPVGCSVCLPRPLRAGTPRGWSPPSSTALASPGLNPLRSSGLPS